MSTSDDFYIDDIVVCKVKDGLIVPRGEKVFDKRLSFKIIGAKLNQWDIDEFVIYVPEYELGHVSTSNFVNHFVCNEFDVDRRFLGEHMLYIRAAHIVQVERKADGARCVNCKEYFEWANPTDCFACSSCRLNPWR